MRRLVLAAALAYALVPVAGAPAARDDLVTVAPGTLGSTNARPTAITPSGRAVAYISSADGRAKVKDLSSGAVTDVAVATDVSLSADGLQIAYATASNQVFLRDLSSADPAVAITAPTVIAEDEREPSISADGQSVAFVSESSAPNAIAQVWVWRAGTSVRASSNAGGDQGNGDSTRPAIAGNGRVVAFSSAATNLVADENQSSGIDAFVRDLDAPQTGFVSRRSAADGGAPASSGDALVGGISEDGARVSFSSPAENLGAGDVFAYDRPSATLLATGAFGTRAAISPDGRFVAFEDGGAVALADLRDGGTPRTVSAAGTAARPSVARSGLFVVFDAGGQVLRREARTPPSILVRPAISGTPQEGQTVQCSQGTWAGNPTTFAYSWLVDGFPVAGATSSSYVVDATDAGRDLRCRVTATNQDESVAEISDGVRPAAGEPAPLIPVVPEPAPVATSTPEPSLPAIVLRVSPRHEKRAPYRFTVRASIAGLTSCEGPLTVEVRRKARRIARKRPAVADCAARSTVTFTGKALRGKGTLSFTASYPGAERVRVSVRFGR